VEISGDRGAAREVINCSSQAAWRQIHPGSVLLGAEGTGHPAVRDDTQLLRSLARSLDEMLTCATEAEVTLGWIDASCHVGDMVEQVEGRALELSSSPAGSAHVQAVRHDFGPQQTTVLKVSG
jgi:hypothetical protein